MEVTILLSEHISKLELARERQISATFVMRFVAVDMAGDIDVVSRTQRGRSSPSHAIHDKRTHKIESVIMYVVPHQFMWVLPEGVRVL